MKDLGPVVKNDCKMIEEAFSKYGSLDFGEKDCYKMINEPSSN